MTPPSPLLPIIRPDVTFDEVADDIRAILASGMLTSGPYVARFEEALARYVGVRHAIATTSATTALHLVLAALDVGPGDEVLVADFTFPATGNVIVQLGAQPVLVDSSFAPPHDVSLAMDLARAEALITPRTKAILVVDPFGRPADLHALEVLAQSKGIALIEDAACALGSDVRSRSDSHVRRCGSFATAGCFSFHPRKVITTGEGGAVTTNDDALAARMRTLRSHGGAPAAAGAVGMRFVANGFNYRLPEISAALGLAQLKRVDAILEDRRTTAARYEPHLEKIPGVVVHRETPGTRWTYQSLVITLADRAADHRDDVVAQMRARGIETTLGTYAMHAHPAFATFGYEPGDLPVSWRLQQTTLTLPLLPRMEPRDVERVVSTLAEVVDAVSR